LCLRVEYPGKTNEEMLERVDTSDLQDIVADRRWRFIGHLIRLPYDTIRYDTIAEFNLDSKAEYSA